MRARTFVALLLGVVVLLGGCAEAERVVTSRDVVSGDGGARTYRVTWVSDAYGQFVYRAETSDADFGECYSKLTLGEPLPDSCLSLRLLRADTDAFNRSVGLAWAALIAFIGGLVVFALRRIAWVPVVSASTEHLASETAAGSPSSAVELMRSAESEKSSRAEAEAGGHDVAHPGWMGVLVAFVTLAVLTMLLGYGTSLSWGRRPGLLMLLGLGGVAVLLVLGRLQRSDMHPLIQRLQFLGGAALTMTVLSVLGMAFRWPLLALNGVAWPF
jgi:hypothetical protein